MSHSLPVFSTLALRLDGPVARLELNRPDKANALNQALWDEIPRAFAWIEATAAVRVVVLAGSGRHFSSGIDLALLMQAVRDTHDSACPGRTRENLRRFIRGVQDSVSSIERCRVPVIAAIHGVCIGAALELVAACDLRYCSDDVRFSLKEVDLGVVADVGGLHRVRHLVGYPVLAEMAYTAREIAAAEAEALHLVNRRYPDRDTLEAEVAKIAAGIAARSPLTVRGIKHNLLYAREHGVQDGLEYAATWNMSMLLSADTREAVAAALEKRGARFRD